MRKLVFVATVLCVWLTAASAGLAEPPPPVPRLQISADGGDQVAGLHVPLITWSPTPLPTSTPSPTPRTASAVPKYVVILVLDGGRPDYLTVPGIPHVQALMRNGTVYSNAFDGILESETPAGHATIGTGMLPKHSGIMGFGWENQSANWVSIFSPTAIDQHVMENLMRGAPSLAQRLHQHDRSAVVAAVGSYKYYANDGLGGPDADITMYYAPTATGAYAPKFVPGHAPPRSLLQRPELTEKSYQSLRLGTNDHLAMLLATDTFKETHARVIMANLPELDYPVGHYDGANRDWKDVTTLMQGFDRDLATLEDAYRKAGVLDQTDFIITADHGFQAFDHTVSPDTINSAVASTGLKVTHGSYESADYLWVSDHSRANEAAAALAGLQNPLIEAVYYKDVHTDQYIRATAAELFQSSGVENANQLLLQSFGGANSPDVVVMFRQGTDGADPSSHWKGDHGGADWESQHIPLILSGPGVRAGVRSSYPARLIDIAPTALSLLGASWRGMDGTPLADALVHPPGGSSQTQAALSGPLTADVQALAAQSAADRAGS